MREPQPRNPQQTAHEKPELGEHPTREKERLQRNQPRNGRIRERGPNTGGGKLRPSDR